MYEYKKRSTKVRKVLILIMLMGVVSITSILVYNTFFNAQVYLNDEQNSAQRLSYYSNKEKEEDNKKDITQILEETIESVVGISKMKNIGSSIFLNNSTSSLGLGTGIIISENGYILTNWHVAGDKYSTCYITLESGETYSGNVVWADKDLDLAIVKVSMLGLKPLLLGDSDEIKIGEKTYAIGNPIGLEFQRTVTAGIISGVNRTIKIDEDNNSSYMEDLIQTDATINPGNSGGPLINEEGEVIGINSVKITEAEGIGFAIPINIVKPIIESFKTKGEFEEAYLGIFAYDKNVIPYLDSKLEFNNGIYVAQIEKNGPSYNSGLKEGDIIIKIDNVYISKMSELRSYIYTKNIGDEISLSVQRNSKEYNIKIKLGKK